MEPEFDALVVGGGPAGQAAALELVAGGARVAVVDEQPRAGGQILRQPPREFRVPRWLLGSSYGALKAQLARFEAETRIEWLGGSSVPGVVRRGETWSVTLAQVDAVREIHAPVVVVATGCQELAVPMPGWTLPGVMAAGAVQALLKSQQVSPGAHLAFAGTHPLQLLVAAQAIEAGLDVRVVAFAQSRAEFAERALRGAGALLRNGSLWWPGADAFATLRRARVPVRFGAQPVAVAGRTRVEALQFRDGSACEADAVALCFGFVPQSDLVRQAGAAVHRTAGGGFAARVDEWQRTNVPGLYAAGESSGVAGAPRAMLSGALAGIAAALDLQRIDAAEASRRARPLRTALAPLDRFSRLLDAIADPARHWPTPAPDTIVCRCEDVTLAEISDAIADSRSANAVKLRTRCGMGLCQGRTCEPVVLRALAARGQTHDPGFTARFPSRPVRIAALLNRSPPPAR